MKKSALLVSFCVILASMNSCRNTIGSYTSNEKFNKSFNGFFQRKSADYEGVYRNPVIIVHGFLGSNLLDTKSGKIIWGEFSTSDSYTISDAKMRALAIPMIQGKPLKLIKDATVPHGMLDKVKVSFLGMTYTEPAYINLVNILHEDGYQPDERHALDKGKNFYTLFQFSYDWRRDLQENAVKLHNFILKKRKYIQEQYKSHYGRKNYDVQFDLIGHSMGGLIARYYLRYGTAELPEENEQPKITWAGSKYIDRLIILGTPNAGYLDTLLEMQNGIELPPIPPALVSTWPAYYQMMPDPSTKSVVLKNAPNKAVDIYNINTWLRYKWGLTDTKKQDKVLKILLPNVKTQLGRAKIAFDHLAKCLDRAKRFKRAMNVFATPPDDVKLYLILGNAVPTRRRARLDKKTGKLLVTKEDYEPGDGKVLVTSAMYDRRAGRKVWVPYFYSPIAWNSIIQLRAAHMGITTDPAFKDNVLFLLSNVPTKRYRQLIEEYRKEDHE